jgi:hypothetical protein
MIKDRTLNQEMAPRGHHATRKGRHGKIPATPGPTTCSPLAAVKTTRRNKGSCLPSTVLKKIAGMQHTVHGGKGKSSSKQATVQKTVLAKKLGCSKSNDRCIIQKSLLSQKEKEALLQAFLRPEMPKEWKKKPDTWLNSDDIKHVMKQYETAYKEFKFLGVVPIDFSAPDPYTMTEKKCMDETFCKVDLKAEKAAGKLILGAVFNLDPHYKSGSHWVALAIDLKRNCVYYFDSYGMSPPNQVARFMRYLTLQEPKLKLESNGRRFQYSNTECGMYSMYFIIRMIAGESFKKFCKNPISDKWMLQYRSVLFDKEDSE